MAQHIRHNGSLSTTGGQGQASSFDSQQTILGHRAQSTGEVTISNNFATITSRDGTVSTDFQTSVRRRSSFADRVSSFRQMGGPNNIDNFIHSIQRAAAFREVIPPVNYEVHGVFSDDEDEGDQTDEEVPSAHDQLNITRSRSRLTDQLGHRNSAGSLRANIARGSLTSEITGLLSNHPRNSWSAQSRSGLDNVLGVSYGSVSANLSSSTRRRISILEHEQSHASQGVALEASTKSEILVPQHIESEVLPDGEVVERIVGESTMPMTIFNSINVMLGVGVLAIPLAFQFAGFVFGTILLLTIAMTTEYTARLLAKCMDTNFACSSYTDIAFISFGKWGRSFVEVIFFLELVISNVAYIILFGDSVHSIADGISKISAECVIAIGLIPMNFIPLKYLSITSILGISSILGIVILLFTGGIAKPEAPGSLRQPMSQDAFPEDYKAIALAYGLLMAPLSGHPIFPAIYKDMRHPYKYKKALRTTYGFMICINVGIILISCLMFGRSLCGSVTTNILISDAYPWIISILLLIMIACIPITKIPLYNRAMIDTINKKLVGDSSPSDQPEGEQNSKGRPWVHRIVKGTTALVINFVLLGLALVFPSFNSVVGILGAALCGLNCIVLPVTFYLKIFWGSDEIKMTEKILCYVLVLVAVLFGAAGTVMATLPAYGASC